MNVKLIYEVPRRVDEEGRVWYRCLSDVNFATAKVGWAVGSTQILHTRNGGKTWVNQFKTDEGCDYLNPHRVFALSSKVCWIVAISSATNIRCCYTRDGGETWKGKEFEAGIYPNDIFFIDSKRGWLVSDNGGFPAHEGRVHLTEDGGESWKVTKGKMEGKPDKIRFYNAEKGWLVEHYVNRDQTRTYSRLHASVDGGYSWRVVKRFDRRISDLHVLAENRLFIVGESGFIAETSNGGQEWKRVENRSRAFINAVRFYHDRVGLALGDNNILLLSQDGGQTWNKIRPATNAVSFVNAHFETGGLGILASSNSIHSFKLD